MSDSQPDNHIDPTAEISFATIKERAVKGVAVLTGRTFLLSIVSLFATGFLTVFLNPSEFGVFWIVSAIVNFLAYFSDVGLAAALIQKKEPVNDEDLRTTFTVQQCLVITLLIILVIITPYLQSIYHLTYQGKFLLYALGISLLMSSLKTIPSALLERELNFTKLVVPQVAENLVYNLVAVFLAWKGYGIASFTYAVLARGIVGLVLMYILKPWKPVISISQGSLKRLLTFGVPYQVNTLMATIKDDGMTAFLGGIIGTTGIGYLGWAQKWAQYPLRLVMDHVLKVTFPAFARMQDNITELKSSVTRSIFFICFLVFPATIGLVILAPLLVKIIPRYSKWEPALIPLFFISFNTIFAAATTQLTNLLNAIGKIKITFKLMIMWTALTWLIIPFLSIKFGVNGTAAGYAFIGLSSVVAIVAAYRIVPFSIRESIFRPLTGALVMAICLLFIRQFLPIRLFSVILLGMLGIILYFVAMFLIIGPAIIVDAKKGIRSIFIK